MESLNWRTPHERLTGSTPDISMIYRFRFYDRVYVKRDESTVGGGFHPSLMKWPEDLSVSLRMSVIR